MRTTGIEATERRALAAHLLRMVGQVVEEIIYKKACF